MLSTQVLREQLNRYADGAMSAESLEEWLAAESWDMRRWAPTGVQRFVGVLQSGFIKHSDAQMSGDELRQFLLRRRDQLNRAHEVTVTLEAARAIVASFIEEASKGAVAGSEAFMLTGATASA